MLTHLSALDPVRFNVDRPHITANQMYALDSTFKRKYSFAVIRNPYQRMVSIWQYELKRALGTKNPDFAKLNDFNVWLKYHAASLDWGRSFMILPQWHWISQWNSNELIVSELWRYEDFNFWLGRLESSLKHKFDQSVVANRSMKQYDYKNIANNESKQIMLELCRVDYERFGYTW